VQAKGFKTVQLTVAVQIAVLRPAM
jgi:hypothetical protein